MGAIPSHSPSDRRHLELAFRLARRGLGRTSPNPMVGAVLVKGGKIIGRGWHHRAGLPHAEIEAIRSASENPRGATLFVTLEPCCTHGRTPPCTEAIIAAGIKRVVVAAIDPNPAHGGHGLKILRKAGVVVTHGLLAAEDAKLNESFRHWIVERTPFVTVKAAMSLDGKIASRNGESKWITGSKARDYGMKLRVASDAILVGVKTIIADDPSLIIRKPGFAEKPWHRIVLDPSGRIPLSAKVLSDSCAAQTIIVVTKAAPAKRVAALEKRVRVLCAPARKTGIHLRWLMRKLGGENITSILVEGGGETNASFLFQGLAQRVAFFYAPMVIGGRDAPKGVAGDGALGLADKISLAGVELRKLGSDLLMTAHVVNSP